MTEADRLDDWAARLEREGCQTLSPATRALLAELAAAIRIDALRLRAAAGDALWGLSPQQAAVLRWMAARQARAAEPAAGVPRPLGADDATFAHLLRMGFLRAAPPAGAGLQPARFVVTRRGQLAAAPAEVAA